MAAPRAQCLLGGPERVSPACGPHDRQVRQVDAAGGERGSIWEMRRSEPDDALARTGEPCQRRHEDADLADSPGRDEELGDCTGRPAAAGKLGIESREAGRHGRDGAGKHVAPPYAGMPQSFLESHDTVILYSIRSPV